MDAIAELGVLAANSAQTIYSAQAKNPAQRKFGG